MTADVVKGVARLCEAYGKPLLVAPKHDWSKYKNCPVTVISANEEEARRAADAGQQQEPWATQRLARTLRAGFPRTSHLVVKLGPEGAAFFADNGGKRVSAAPVKVVHTLRAGDVFDAFLLAALLRDYDIAQAVRLANLAAGVACTKQLFEWPVLDDVVVAVRGDGEGTRTLTTSMRKILSLINQGIASTSEIAACKQVATSTAAKEIQDLKRTLGAPRRTQIVPFAERYGLVTPAMRIRTEDLEEA